ncbi:MAG: hypothetical protein ABR570_09430 [Burkholderiales bacterium]
MSRTLAIALLLALSACGTTGGVPADFLNPQAPQAGPPFPYNSPWCN